MASIVFPSPNSSPSAASPTSAFSPPTLSTSPLNSSEGVLPPTASQPDQTNETPVASSPSTSSAPPPSTSTVPDTPPPPPPVSPAPTSPSPPITSAPPPSVPASPPPTTPASTPPSTPASPPPSIPASPPPSPPLLPPPSNPATPPLSQSTPPPPQSLSPPIVGSPPSQFSPAPPALSPPPPQVVSPAAPSPPPPVNPATPPTPNRGPPERSSPPAFATPPPSDSQSAPPPPPSSDGPPGPELPSSPPSIPSTTSPPSLAPPAPSNDAKPSGSPPLAPLPSIPTEKPTARSTDGVSSNDSSTHKGGRSTGGGVAIGVAVGFVILSLVFMAVWFINKQKRRSGSRVGYPWSSPAASSQNSATLFLKSNSPARFYGSTSGSELMYSPSEQGGMSNSKAWFTYEELVQATKSFSEQNLLGEGGFGCVYKGLLSDGREVAVKQLKIGSGQGEREFKAEVEIISRVHHRHLVSLVGYCISEHQRLLVYEYVPNNTLHNHLHGVEIPVMSWGTRVRVAAGSARGIAYLHEDCHPRIIHRDIKSSNILLDNNFEARVADFGLAKLALDSNTHVTTRVMGTFGYMAPEYATSGKLTEKSDVYSFGVVLLELITGRKPVDDSQPIGDESLVEWARPLLTRVLDNENIEGLVDPRLENNYDPREMFRMIEAAAACVRHSAAKRPRMSQVVRALVSLDELSDLTNGMKPGQSEIFNSAEQSAQIRMFQRMAFGSQDYSTSFFNETHSSWRTRERGDSNFFPDNNRSGAWNV